MTVHQELLEICESIGDIHERLQAIGNNDKLCKVDERVLGLTIFAGQSLVNVKSHVEDLLKIFPGPKGNNCLKA